MWAHQPEEPEGNGSGGDSLGGYEGDDAELFSANEKFTLALVGAGILTVIILSWNNQLKCFQALVFLMDIFLCLMKDITPLLSVLDIACQQICQIFEKKFTRLILVTQAISKSVVIEH